MQYLTLVNHEGGNMTIQTKTIYTINIISFKDLLKSQILSATLLWPRDGNGVVLSRTFLAW